MSKLVWKEMRSDGAPIRLTEACANMDWLKALHLAQSRPPGIFIHPTALRTIQDHVSGSRIEVGGLLLGEVFEWPDCHLDYPYASWVGAAMPARQLSQSPVFLEMDASVWSEARASHPQMKILGWFHSHPDLGAFFSGTDRHTQRHFFHLPHQIGLVIDSYRDQTACFAGCDSEDVSHLLCHAPPSAIGSLGG